MFRSPGSSNRKWLAGCLLILMLVTSGLNPASAGPIRSVMIPSVSGLPATEAAAASSGMGWVQVNQNGFGDPNNNRAESLEVFGGQLYAGVSNFDNGGQVWRYTGGTTWSAVSDLRFGSTDIYANDMIRDMIEFNGQLYVCTYSSGGGQIWRSPNGTDWTQVERAGFGNPDNTDITSFAVFKNRLYAATENSNSSGLEIWRSSTGNRDDWVKVVTGGKGNANNTHINSLMEFDGYLYAAVFNPTDGAEIWRTDNGTTWTTVSSGGFDSPNNRWAGGFAIFGGYLYVGTSNNTTGGQIWYSNGSNNGTNWTRVLGNGFGDINNDSIGSLIDLDGLLYAGTDNMTSGIEMWRSSDGTTWPQQVNEDGFGKLYHNMWLLSTVVFNGHLYISAYNSYTGAEVWELLGYPVYLPLVMREYAAYFEGPWEAEPNNTYLQANGPLRSDQDYYGYPNDQKDYFSINLSSGGQIVVDLTNDTAQGVQLQLFYQTVDNRVDYVLNAPYHIQYTAQPGLYYIYIYTAGNYSSSAAYTLHVTYP